MSRQAVVGMALLILAGLDLTLAVLGIARYPALFIQHGAWIFVAELVGVLLVYGAAASLFLRQRGPAWQTISKYSGVYGCITSGLELVSLAIETWLPAWAHGGIFSVGIMVSLFVLWGIAGGWAARTSGVCGGVLPCDTRRWRNSNLAGVQAQRMDRCQGIRCGEYARFRIHTSLDCADSGVVVWFGRLIHWAIQNTSFATIELGC